MTDENDQKWSPCPMVEPHHRHEWYDRFLRVDCPGIHYCGMCEWEGYPPRGQTCGHAIPPGGESRG